MDVLVPVPSERLEEVVYAGTPQGVFVSRDGASSWASANVGLPDNLGINHIAVSPVFNTDGTLIAALSGGLFSSANRGMTWTNATNGFQGDSPAASHVVFSPNFINDATVFATVTERKTGSFRTVEEIYRSDRRRGDLDPGLRGQSGHVPGNQDGHIARLRPRRHPVRVHLPGFAPLSGQGANMGCD